MLTKKLRVWRERKKLRWLLLGFFIGPLSYAVFWELPLIITGHSIISETNILLLLISIPVTFSIAIVKHQLMDINFIIQRSIVYALLLMGIIIIYIALTSFLSLFIINVNPALPSVLTAFTTVILLNPVKNYVKHFVDKKFFKVEYDYRTELENFLTDIKESTYIQELADKIVRQTDSLIPTERIGFFLLNDHQRIELISSKGWEILKGRSLRFESENLKTDLPMPVAVDDKVEPGLKVESADIKVFKRWGMVLVFPVKSPSGTIHAFLVMGEKQSGRRFYKDDIDLLNTVSLTTALTIDRMKLQEELIRQQLQAERLQELNKLQSFFVNAITHELKNPLTAIKNFTELLKTKKDLNHEKSLQFLSIIEGESERLNLLINNVLDYSKMGETEKSYRRKIIEPNNLIQDILLSIDYQFKMADQFLINKAGKEKVYINADPFAFEIALLNILTNAIKYSEPKSCTIVSTASVNEEYVITVADEGRGIDSKKIKKIFEPYYRIDDDEKSFSRGTGIGLTIVKHIIEEHNGRLNVESSPGNGSKFIIKFPRVYDEKNTNN